MRSNVDVERIADAVVVVVPVEPAQDAGHLVGIADEDIEVDRTQLVEPAEDLSSLLLTFHVAHPRFSVRSQTAIHPGGKHGPVSWALRPQSATLDPRPAV